MGNSARPDMGYLALLLGAAAAFVASGLVLRRISGPILREGLVGVGIKVM